MKNKLVEMMKDMDECVSGAPKSEDRIIFAITRADYPILADKIIGLIKKETV